MLTSFRASKTVRADVFLEGVKKADLGRSGTSFASRLFEERRLGVSRSPAVLAAYESPFTTLSGTETSSSLKETLSASFV